MSDENQPGEPTPNDVTQSDEGLPGGGPVWSGDDAFGGFGNQTPHRNPQDLGVEPPEEETQPPAGDEAAGGHAADPGVSSTG